MVGGVWQWCDTAFNCFVSCLRLGLIYGGGLGEVLLPGVDQGKFSGQTFFDLSFFIVITTIGLNVVFGIIIDTFSELRDEKFQIAAAMENECFVCGIKNHVFEQRSTGFRHHITEEHNMWNYLYFMIYLDTKDSTEYSSHEEYVSNILDEDVDVSSFFPVDCALSLKSVQQDDLGARVESMEHKVDLLLHHFKSIEESLASMTKPQRLNDRSQSSIYISQSSDIGGSQTQINNFGEDKFSVV